MQVSVEAPGAIERRLSISVPAEKIDAEIAKRLLNIAKNARISGFRPGKAPQSIIKKRYAPQVTNEVINEIIQANYSEALGQEKIFPAGLVSIEPGSYEPGKEFQFVATVELFPEIPSPTLAGKIIEKPVVEVTAEDVVQTIEDIRKRNANYVRKSGTSANEDRITIDFDGRIDGEPFPGGSANDFAFVLGAGQMLPAFDTALVGVKEADIRSVDFTFPAEYDNKDVAGKDVRFKVTVKSVEKPELPALDDGFAKLLGIEEGGFDRMKQEVETSLKRELDNRLRSVLRDKVMEALFAANQIEIPKALVEEEIERSVKAMGKQLIEQGLPTDGIDRNQYADEARKRVALGLIARGVIEKFEIKVNAEDLRSRIEEMSSGYEDSQAYVQWHFSDPERLKQIEAVMLEEQVVRRMLDTATIKEQKISFKAFMSPQ